MAQARRLCHQKSLQRRHLAELLQGLKVMLKGMGNLAAMFKQAQQFQGKMSEMQENLGHLRVEGQAGGGMVTVEATGHQKILNIRVEESLLESDDREMLEDLLVAAVNQALEKAKEAAAEEMAKMTGDMNLPGLDEALSKFGLTGGPDGPLEA